MSAITAKASRKMKKYAVLTREPRCFLGSFDFSWEQRKLGEIGSVSMCRRIFKEQTSETGDIPFYKIGTFGADPDAFISRELFEEYKSKYPYPQKGDILISASGSIGRTVEFAGNNEYFQDSNIVWLNHDERLSNPFLKCFYSVVKWAGIEGSTIKRLYNDNILNTVICMPSVPEQKRIGLFFENLDNLITLHQRKCALLFSPFQAFISMMFTTSTFSWEQRKLGDISEIKTGPFGSTLHADDYVSDGTPIITTEHFKTGALPRSKNGLPQVSDSDYKRLTAYTLDDGDIVFSRVGSVDINALITPFQSNWLFSGRVLRVRPQTDISSKFLHTRLETESIKTDIRTRAVGQTMPSINTEILKITPLVLPSSAAEQEQIGSYFAALDNLITLHQRELEKLQNIKKSMLEKMFV